MVISSMPGYGFSGKPTETGWGAERIALAWIVLMKRLGYTSYVAQGGDWGAVIVDLMGMQAPKELLAIHTNMPGVVPPAIDAAAFTGAPVPAGLSADEKHAYEQLAAFYKDVYYALFMGTRPQTLTALADSPVGLATFMIDHDARSLELIARSFNGVAEGLTRDDVLDNITLFWLTNTGVSAARLYWERQARLLFAERRQDPGGRERLSGRALPGAAELGGAGVSQAHPLQQARQRRALRRLGAAEDPDQRTQDRVPIATLRSRAPGGAAQVHRAICNDPPSPRRPSTKGRRAVA